MDIPSKSKESLEAVSRERAYLILRALIRSSYFGEIIPSAVDLQKTTRMSQGVVDDALGRLKGESLIEEIDGKYKYLNSSEAKKGTAAFLLNTDMFEKGYSVFQDYFIGFEETLRASDYHSVFRSNFDTIDHKLEIINEYHRSGISGVALASYSEPRLRKLVLERGVPAVLLGNAETQQQDLGCISNNNFLGMQKIVNYLIEHNHSTIAYYTTGVRLHDGFQERLLGYEAALRQVGLPPIYDLVFGEQHHPSIVRRAIVNFLSMQPKPTAIACSCDRDAFELLAEFQRSGVNVPQDVSITGFDNVVPQGVFGPSLTTMEIHARDIGRTGAEYLLREMVHPQMPVHISLPTELVIRESTGPFVGKDSSTKIITSRKTARLDLPDQDNLLTF
jgi:LacI family transcriptional regulator